ncbi:MAG: hypothetical protein ACTS6G_03790 [Candidatus Hodgkinia cicadicola]
MTAAAAVKLNTTYRRLLSFRIQQLLPPYRGSFRTKLRNPEGEEPAKLFNPAERTASNVFPPSPSLKNVGRPDMFDVFRPIDGLRDLRKVKATLLSRKERTR